MYMMNIVPEKQQILLLLGGKLVYLPTFLSVTTLTMYTYHPSLAKRERERLSVIPEMRGRQEFLS